MSAPSFGLRCQFGIRIGRNDPLTSECPAEISNAESERHLFHAAETFGFAKYDGQWLCVDHRSDSPKKPAAVVPIKAPKWLTRGLRRP